MLTVHSVRLYLAQIVVASVVVLLGPSLALAQVIECGAVLGPGGKFILEEDLVCLLDTGPGSPDTALTVDGATLDMNGHIVDCVIGEDGGTGILLIGAEAKIFNGTVMNCEDDVIIAGTGGHVVKNVILRGSGDEGFTILSDENKLIGNIAARDDINGSSFIVDGNKNKLKDNVVINEGGLFGFEVRGDDNTLIGNAAIAGSDDGIVVFGVRNTIKNNTALDHNQGVDIDGNCDSNLFKNNTFETSSDPCIE